MAASGSEDQYRRDAARTLSVLIALIGVTFTGIIVALAINPATLSFRQVHYVSDEKRLIDSE